MEQHEKMMTVSWVKFAAMIATSVVVMFFLMYQLVYSFDHAPSASTGLFRHW